MKYLIATIEEIENNRMSGIYEEYYDNGDLKLSYMYKQGRKNGRCVEWFEGGQTKEITDYREGVVLYPGGT